MPKFVEIDVHFSPEERALIESIAEEKATDIMSYVKRVALRAARRDLREAAKARSLQEPD
jgi:uncharacterized protein (DUF1778 family)